MDVLHVVHKITWEPFILNRSIPTSGISIRAYLSQVYGDASYYEASRKRLAAAGLQCDPPISFTTNDRLLFPTIDSHRLVEFCKRVDFPKHEKLVENLFHQYFEEGKNFNGKQCQKSGW